MTTSRIDTWIKVGYKILATEGVEGIKIERLARALKLNKSGFYYYFGTLKAYSNRLLEYHVDMARAISEEVKHCGNIDPDLLLLVVRRREFFLVESQLHLRGKPAFFDGDIDEAGELVNKAIVPLWKKSSGLQLQSSVALAYLNIIQHFFYARIYAANINYEFLHKLTAETKGVLNDVVAARVVSPQGKQKSAQFG